MNIFEKIKQFFKGIGNKQKLLDEAQNLDKNDQTSVEKSTNPFLENLKSDATDLLDPQFCRGYDLIPNILRSLGANKDVIKNPNIIDDLSTIFCDILAKNDIKIEHIYDLVSFQPTKYQIDSIVEYIKSPASNLLSESEIMYQYSLDKPYSLSPKISIDKQTGAITIQQFQHSKKTALSIVGIDQYSETTYSSDNKGGSVSAKSVHNYEPYSKDSSTIQTTSKYNEDGILMEEENSFYDRKNGEDTLTGHYITKRDSQYPYIKSTQDLSQNTSAETKYSLIDMNELQTLRSHLIDTKDRNGNSERHGITFSNREQIAKYHEEHKESINKALTSKPQFAFCSMEKISSLQNGLKKLAVKAGILLDGQEQVKG